MPDFPNAEEELRRAPRVVSPEAEEHLHLPIDNFQDYDVSSIDTQRNDGARRDTRRFR